jgi:hypothetical protein
MFLKEFPHRFRSIDIVGCVPGNELRQRCSSRPRMPTAFNFVKKRVRVAIAFRVPDSVHVATGRNLGRAAPASVLSIRPEMKATSGFEPLFCNSREPGTKGHP